MNLKTKFFLGAIIVGLCSGAQAELVWEKTELDLKPAANDATAVGNFKYENKGDKPIHINAVRTSCGCTTAALQKNDVAPGEKGEIVATFKIGDRTGLQQKTVTVETDDPKQPSTVLTLKALITQALELRPSFVYWNANEEAKPKTIVATTSKDAAIKKLEVISSSPDFTTHVEPGAAPGEFKINVQPKETTKMISTTLTIKPDAPGTTGKVYYARAQVAAPAPAAAAATPAAATH